MNGKTTERFLKYVQVGTSSKEDVERFPSTETQIAFAKQLQQEMTAMGMTNVRRSEKGYVFGEIPATAEENFPVIGFIAHISRRFITIYRIIKFSP